MRRAAFVGRVSLVLLIAAAATSPRLAPGAAAPGDAREAAAPKRALAASLFAPDVTAWAAQGSCVALATEGGGVRVVDIATGDELVLPGSLGAAGEMRFSPRGGRLAISLRVDGKADVYLLDLDGRGGPRLHRLTLTGGGDPRWLGAGDRLIYQAPDAAGGFGIFVRDQGGLGPARPFWGDDAVPQTPVTSTIS